MYTLRLSKFNIAQKCLITICKASRSDSSKVLKMNNNDLKGVHLDNIVEFLENFAPDFLSESWDNTGLIVQPVGQKLIKNILLTNDLTEEVLSEAISLQTGLIISYHPPIIKPLNKITASTWKERIISLCLRHDIAVFSPHTTWDSTSGGMNDWLAKAFKYKNMRPIIKHPKIDNEDMGSGRYLILKEQIKLSDAIELVKSHTNLKIVKVALAKGASLETKILKVAICAGSGASVLAHAAADLYVTGEMSHHAVLDAIHCGTNVILCNHSSSERGFLQEIVKILESEYDSAQVLFHLSEKDKDPLVYI